MFPNYCPRRILSAALSLAALFVAACSKPATELSFCARAEEMSTKGWVTGGALYDSPDPLSAGTVPREIRLSSYVHFQDGTGEDYLRDEPFTCRDGSWRHAPAIYWPLGSTMDGILYSTTSAPSGLEWGEGNAALTMRADFGEEFLQDDILYASFWHRQSLPGIGVTMKHAQAWIEVVLKSCCDREIVVNSVILTDIFTSGRLEVRNNYGNAEASWDFRSERARELTMPCTAYGSPLETEVRLNVLIPEQVKTGLRICYSCEGEPETRCLCLSHSNWLPGVRYVYEIDF